MVAKNFKKSDFIIINLIVLTLYYGGPQLSRQNTIHHGKIKFVTAKYNSKQQIQITPGRLQTLTAKTKTIIAIQNSSRQEQNTRGKSKTLTAKAKRSRQNQEWRSAVNGQRLSKYVVYRFTINTT